MSFDWRRRGEMGMATEDGKMISVQSRCKVHRKVRSAILLCSGILFCTAVLFVLVSLDPSKVSDDPRLLVTFPYRIRNHPVVESGVGFEEEVLQEEALEGMGTLFRRGTRAMPELVVAHLDETTTPEDLRLFLRGLHRSGSPARADVVLLFPWRPVPREFAAVIRHEEASFQRLLRSFRKLSHPVGNLSVFNPGAYSRAMPVGDYGKRAESVWGTKKAETGSDAVHYGAVVAFDVQELDPDDTLSGFLDAPPAALRRWVCYQMLIGMLRHRFRHILLTEVTGVVILKDALSSLKRKDTSLHLYCTGERWSDGAMGEVYALEDEDKPRKVISTGVILGGTRQVRSVATGMATEIVRLALQHKDRVPLRSDAPVLSFLVHKSSSLGKKVASHLQVHESGTSIANILPGPPRDDFFRKPDTRFSILQGLLKSDRRATILQALRQDICESDVETVYEDCSSSSSRPQTDDHHHSTIAVS